MHLIEEGTNATTTNASERATNATAIAPYKKDNIHKKRTAATKKSTSEGDVEVLSDSSYDTDLAASSDSDDDWSGDYDTEFDPND